LLLSFFFSSRRRHTRFSRDWSSDVCSSDLAAQVSPSDSLSGTTHSPLPSHVPAPSWHGVSAATGVAVHSASATQLLSAAQLASSSTPSYFRHSVSPGQTKVPHASSLAGAVHVPSLPAWSQVAHTPWQLVSQHTPSTQNPDSQSDAPRQVVPLLDRLVPPPSSAPSFEPPLVPSPNAASVSSPFAPASSLVVPLFPAPVDSPLSRLVSG